MFERVILLTGMPRSGTSWLSQIFDSSPLVRFRLSPLFSYEFKNALDESATAHQWARLLSDVYATDSEFMEQRRRRQAGEYPVFSGKEADPPILVIKDTRFHNLTRPMLEQVRNLLVVAIVRHPCGAIHSWLTTPHEFPAEADPLEEWRSGDCRKDGFGEYWGFEDWKRVTRMHQELAAQLPDRVMIQRYEDLTRDALGETRKMFQFCGIDVGLQTQAFLRRSQHEHVDNEYAVFKRPSVSERWREQLQLEIGEAILSEIAGTSLEQFLR